MKGLTFAGHLLICTVVAAAGVWALGLIPELQPHTALGWYTIGLFTLLTLMFFVFGRMASAHREPTLFVMFSYMTIGLKLALSLILIILYRKYVNPEGKLFILPFFWVYTVYTVYEVYMLSKIGQTRKAV